DGYGRVDASSGPDELTYTRTFSGPTALAGPIEADVWLSSTAPDTDVFVQLIDVDPQGNYQFLQRGMLRASFRAVDEARSDRIGRASCCRCSPRCRRSAPARRPAARRPACGACIPRRGDRQDGVGCAVMTIQGIPKRSVHMPKAEAKNV